MQLNFDMFNLLKNNADVWNAKWHIREAEEGYSAFMLYTNGFCNGA